MPLSYKLAISFLIVGLLNLIFQRNRNWIFGYRSRRSIKTHDQFAYANRIYGTAMMIFGFCYLLSIWYLEYFKAFTISDWGNAVPIVSYFSIVFIVIEFQLGNRFGE